MQRFRKGCQPSLPCDMFDSTRRFPWCCQKIPWEIHCRRIKRKYHELKQFFCKDFHKARGGVAPVDSCTRRAKTFLSPPQPSSSSCRSNLARVTMQCHHAPRNGYYPYKHKTKVRDSGNFWECFPASHKQRLKLNSPEMKRHVILPLYGRDDKEITSCSRSA